MPGTNRLTLDATVHDRGDLRYTPAGIPVLDLTLRHVSVQSEAGGKRRVECEIAAIAFDAAARSLAGLAPGTMLRCEGFLARRWRTGTSVALHLTNFELTKGNDDAPSDG